MSTLIFKTITRAVTPIIMLFSLYLLLRGHQLPGGGFIAGLMTSAGVVLIYLAYGYRFDWRHRGAFFYYLFSAGLAVAFFTGLAGLFFGGSFLKSGVVHVEMPLIHETWAFVSAAVFDFGVFLVVCGVCVTIMTLLGEEAR